MIPSFIAILHLGILFTCFCKQRNLSKEILKYCALFIKQNNFWNFVVQMLYILRTLENFKMDLAPVVNKNRTHLSSFE